MTSRVPNLSRCIGAIAITAAIIAAITAITAATTVGITAAGKQRLN